MEKTKKPYQSKTNWALLISFAVFTYDYFSPFIPKEYYPQIFAVIGIFIGYLRNFKTNQKIGL